MNDHPHGFTVEELADELCAATVLAPSPAAERALRAFAGQLAGTIDQRGSEPYGWAEPLREIERGDR
jgi:hypothetical protein